MLFIEEHSDKSFTELISLAKQSEEQGDIAKTITLLNLALKKAPDIISKKETYEKLLEYYLNDTNPKRAIKTLQNLILIDKNNSKYYKQLAGILLEQGEIEKAKKFSEIAYAKTKDKYFIELFKTEDQTLEIEDIKFDETTLSLLYTLFSGREGVYARQWKDQKGNTGYIPIHEPLSEKAIKNHLLGNHTIGIYQLRMDNTVNWMVFDIDIAKYALKQVLIDDKKWEKIQNILTKQAEILQQECNKFNINTYLEDSGFKGRHCWVFFEKPVIAKLAKKFGEVLIGNIKRISPDITIEVFPKQNYVKKDGLGNLVKMPLGIHLKTGKRSFFYTKEGKVKDLNSFLKQIKKTSQENLTEYLSYYKIKENYDIEESSQIIPSQKEEFPILVQKYIPEEDEELQYILYKCPVLKEIYKKAINQNELTPDEIIIITHTLGYLKEGVNAVNYILSKCINISSEKFLKSKLKGNPISCGKIRARIPDTTVKVDCSCLFEKDLGMYPTPILHLKKKTLDKEALISANLDAVNVQHAIDEYLKLKKEFFEITRLLKIYENKLLKIFEEAGVTELKTPSGTLVKSIENGKPIITIKL